MHETVVPKYVYPLCHCASFYASLVSFHLQIAYRKVRNLQKVLMSLYVLWHAMSAVCIVNQIINEPAIAYAMVNS